MFKRNEGILDRIARVTLGLILLPSGLFLLGGLHGSVLGLVTTGLGTLGLVTGVTGVCAMYVPFGISTLDMERGLMERCMSMMGGGWSGARSCGGGMCGPQGRATRRTHDQHEQAAPGPTVV